MELLKFCALCLIMAISQLGSSEAETEHFDLIAGDSFSLICDPKLPVQQLISGYANVFRKLPDITVYRNIDIMDNTENYTKQNITMKLMQPLDPAIFNYTFTELRVEDSGSWQCLKVHTPSGEKTFYRNMTLSVKPAADVSRVELTLNKLPGGKAMKVIQEGGGENPATKTVRLLSGKYAMSCASENGHPDPEYSLMLNGKELTTEQTAMFNLTTADRNVGCIVKVPRPNFNSHTLSFQLTIEDVEPEIKCQTAQARVSDRGAVMNCTVVAADVTCKRVVWKAGTTNQDLEHGGNKIVGYNLECSSNGENSVMTSLEVKNLEQRHFDDTYFVRIKDLKTGDYQKEHRLQLLKKPGALSGAIQMTSLGSVALVAMVTILKMVL